MTIYTPGKLVLAKTTVSPVTAYVQGLGIVTDGLVLNLDAGTPLSYPGTGTTWTDLSGNGNNGTLENGVGYNSSNGGTLSFDGVDDYISGSSASIPISNAFTISAWVRHNTLPNSIQRYLTMANEVGVIRHDGGTQSGQLHFYIKTSGTLKLNLRVNNALVINTWYYIVGTWDGTTSRLYRNAIQIGTDTPGGTLDGGNLNYFLSLSAESLNGNIAQASIYNRALTASEITQNYNAFRGRYGL
jgi:hypothetical protein